MKSLGAMLAISAGVLGAAWARPAPTTPTTPANHSYRLERIWQRQLGYHERAAFAVCPDGRTYVVTRSQRLVVLDADGAYMDRERRVRELVHAQAAACGPKDLLYAAGSHFEVIDWSGPKAISLVSFSSLPLPIVAHMAVATSGEALLEGLARKGGSRLCLVRQDGSLIAGLGESNDKMPPWKRQIKAFRYSLAYDARGRRFVEAPWDEYEFRTYSLRGKALGTFRRKDPSFAPGALPASSMAPAYAGDEVRSVVALPGGGFLTQVVKQGPGPRGMPQVKDAYLEIFNRGFRLVATHIPIAGRPYGVVRGADRRGNLYFGYQIVGGEFGVVKARLVAEGAAEE